jgi:hypothetical protein
MTFTVQGYATFLLGKSGSHSLISTFGVVKNESSTLTTTIVQYNSPLTQAPECVDISSAPLLYCVTPLPFGQLQFGYGLPLTSTWEITPSDAFTPTQSYLTLHIQQPELPNYTISFALTPDYVVESYFTQDITLNQNSSFYPLFYYLVGANFKTLVNSGGSFLLSVYSLTEEYPCLSS